MRRALFLCSCLILPFAVSACATRHRALSPLEKVAITAQIIVEDGNGLVIGTHKIDGLSVLDEVETLEGPDKVEKVVSINFRAKRRIRDALNDILERHGLGRMGHHALEQALARGQVTCHTGGYEDPLYTCFSGVGSTSCRNALVLNLEPPADGVPTLESVGLADQYDPDRPLRGQVPDDAKGRCQALVPPPTATWTQVLPLLKASLTVEVTKVPPSPQLPRGAKSTLTLVCLGNIAKVMDAETTDWGLAQAAAQALGDLQTEQGSLFDSHLHGDSMASLWEDPRLRELLEPLFERRGVTLDIAGPPGSSEDTRRPIRTAEP